MQMTFVRLVLFRSFRSSAASVRSLSRLVVFASTFSNRTAAHPFRAAASAADAAAAAVAAAAAEGRRPAVAIFKTPRYVAEAGEGDDVATASAGDDRLAGGRTG